MIYGFPCVQYTPPIDQRMRPQVQLVGIEIGDGAALTRFDFSPRRVTAAR